ncbi:MULTISPECIES: DUF4389 domain-containing protein [unclassified Maridesulfovibrio]|uniref:DUF4389 domain-containing protein n=1 Tax=unclassified Maridesulfovibrio TaxID=2794999 RepID=UPI003B3D43BE
MNNAAQDRIAIGKRFLRTIVCIVAFELVRILAYAIIFVQYAFLLITGSHLTPLREFADRLSNYAFSLLKYATLNSNVRPFPFSDFPAESKKTPSSSDIDFS